MQDFNGSLIGLHASLSYDADQTTFSFGRLKFTNYNSTVTT